MLEIQTKVSRVVDAIEVDEFFYILHENHFVHRWVPKDNNNNALEQEVDDEETIRHIANIHATEKSIRSIWSFSDTYRI